MSDEASFWTAVTAGDRATVEALVQTSPAAAFNGQAEMVDTLLRHGADPRLRDEDGQTAADHARERGHAPLAERLGSPAWS